MPLQFEKASGDLWATTAHFGEPRVADDLGVTVTIGGAGGEPDATSMHLAEKLCETLLELQHRATQHLDQFIDRARIGPGATWWLDEIEIRRMRLGRPTFRLRFALTGDDGVEWYVDMAGEADTFRGYRIERYDGLAAAHPG